MCDLVHFLCLTTFSHQVIGLYFTFTAIYPLIEKIGPSISSLTIFVGINGDSEELNLPASNIWAFTGYVSK